MSKTVKNLSVCALLLWSSTLLTAQDTASRMKLAEKGSPTFTFSERTPRYALRPGDIVELGFEFSPEFNQTATVQPDGFMSLRGIGDVLVGGKTLPEFTSSLKEAYGKILNKPVITVVLKDFEKPYFIASGQVSKPGKYELRGNTSLTEAIAMAGGFNDVAKHSRVVLYRRVTRNQQDYFQATVFDLKKMMKTNNLQEDAYLKPGDMIYVPRSGFSEVKRYIPAPGVGMYMTPSF